MFLASQLQINTNDLELALASTKNYRHYHKAKRSGGFRIISVPPEPLKKVQRLILKRLFYKIPFRVYPVFHSPKSIVDHAQRHYDTHLSCVLRLDLKNAFPSVKEEYFHSILNRFIKELSLIPRKDLVAQRYNIHRRYCKKMPDKCSECNDLDAEQRQLFKLSQFNNRLSLPVLFWLRNLILQNSKYNQIYDNWFLLARNKACFPDQLSLFPDQEYFTQGFPEFIHKVGELLITLCFERGQLPQGAPTSPFLLEIAIKADGISKRLSELSERLKYIAAGENSEPPISLGIAVLPENMLWLQEEKPADKIVPLSVLSPYFYFGFYADDLTVSSRHSLQARPMAPEDQRTVKDMIIEAVEKGGWFKVNRKKDRIYHWRKEHPLVTGLRLGPKGVVLPKKRIRWLRSYFNHINGKTEKKEERDGHLAFLKMVYGDKLPSQLKIKN